MKKIYGVVLALVALGSCRGREDYLFRELDPSETGVTFANTLAESPELNILNYLYYYNGAGVAVADFNGDGLPDLYFVSNQQADALYLNRGHLQFEDITTKAGIRNDQGWTTGVTHVDINADGLLDLYVCKASGYRSLNGRNMLYVNQGPDKNGIPRFEEQAADYGLDFSGLSTQAAFLDYDLDGDLDLFLMNHSVHPNRNYGRGSQREGYDALSGDRLFRNDAGSFTDVSREAGIFQGKAGYGLGLSVGDLDNDGYPDIYIGNDFFENDYLYMNQGDGSFREVISGDHSPIGHTTHFSMGNDIADVNNDGLADIISLDMLPEDLVTYKTSGLEYGYPIYQQYLKNGFSPQYMQNTLQLNAGDGHYSEIGFLGGLASTEWSWGTLLADLDNDGMKDVFITNGIKGATNDMDYMNFIANEDIQRRIDAGMSDSDMPLTREIPAKKVPNYIFRNTGELRFEDMAGKWMQTTPTYSHGCVYADLDRDGDLDLVVNHMDQTASVYQNTLSGNTSLRVTFKGDAGNPFGIGARVLVYSGQQTMAQENFPTRGYLSAVAPELTFGLGAQAAADSLLVIWPGGAFQRLTNLPAGGNLLLDQKAAGGHYYREVKYGKAPWVVRDSLIPFVHLENPTLDFDREPLIPYAYSNQGPDLSIVDFNRDGLDDVFIGGAKRQASALFLQEAGGVFAAAFEKLFEEDALSEDTAHVFFDADGDSWPDLLVASGGNEFRQGDPVRPRLYMNREGIPFRDHSAFEGVELNASDLVIFDLEGDGDPDILITSDAVPGAYGDVPRHYVLENDGAGHFTDVTARRFPGLLDFGAVSAAVSGDFDGDGQAELAVAGHWTPVSIFKSRDGIWQRENTPGLGGSAGWWNTLEAVDIDSDGDLDLLGGNWGLNSKFRASAEAPLRLYRNDFDGNGAAEPLVTYYHNGVETPFASRDELGKQMPFLNKKFRTYKGFAEASLDDLFGADALEQSRQTQVTELRSTLYLNQGDGSFRPQPLPRIAQASAVFDIFVDDLDGDADPDVLLVGNLYEISTQLGRLDALNGLVLTNDGKGGLSWAPELSLPLSGAARKVDTLRVDGKKTYIIGRNDMAPALFQKDEK
ncbi:VCBS repeat-containing protein [Robiginitalea sp. SC105]|uniref:VCBS repeat-containing protein n=1 Tax=Robiginitalea sp. SC105 TaxID=2762332 RepID=UPI00163A5A8E|nr:VCBS repeat-containing protein [Robiginitalea sp. SC105]MBC2837858.1 VCBS repeat-containing protein [Robiginitalea sp. SC105]